MKRSYWHAQGALAGMLLILWGTVAWAADEIRIGIIGPMEYSYGQSQWNGAQMAAEEINAAGGIAVGDKKMQIKLFKADSKEYASVAIAAEAMESLIKKNKCHFVIGGLTSEATMAMQDVAMENKTIFYSAGAAHPELCNRVVRNYDRYKYYFRGAPFNSDYLFKNLLHQLRGVAVLLNKRLVIDNLKVAILAEQAIWVEPIIEQLQNTLPKSGMEIAGIWRTQPRSADLAPELRAIVKSGSQIIVTIINGPSGTTLGRQYGEMKIPAVVMGIISQAGTLQYKHDTMGMCNYIMTSSTYTLGLEINELTKPFVHSYYKRFNELPQNTANTYAIIRYTLKNAIEITQSLDPDKLIPVLEKSITKIPAGTDASGRDERGRPTHDLVWGPKRYTGIAAQWQDGELVAVWPHLKWVSPYWEFSVEPSLDPKDNLYKGIEPFKIAPWMLEAYGKKQ